MDEHYNELVAHHYSEFRPPLHAPTLATVLDESEKFPLGIDIGCGTGYSAIALANYCDQVIGLDPSSAMLADAVEHPKVSYICGNAESLSKCAIEQSVDIVTFAGSLYYAKSMSLEDQLSRACNPNGLIIVYDFEVLLEECLADLGLAIPSVASDYDHLANVDDWDNFSLQTRESTKTALDLSPVELAHIVLSDSNRFIEISKNYSVQDPFHSLVDELHKRGKQHSLVADTFSSRYRYSPK